MKSLFTHLSTKRLFVIGFIVGFAFVTSGCSGMKQDDKEFSCKNSPTACAPGRNTKVLLMPDGFRNVVFTCNGSTGVYVTSRGWTQNGSGDLPSLPSGITAVANDSACS